MGVPLDLSLTSQGLLKRRYREYDALSLSGELLDPAGVQRQILINLELQTALSQLGANARIGTFDLTTTPQQIIRRSKVMRGYLVNNQGGTSATNPTPTLFASASRAAGQNINSSNINVSDVSTVAFLMDVTVLTGSATIRVDLQTQDPLSSNFAVAQVDLFPLATATGTYYANVDGIGIDNVMRLNLVTATDTTTLSISGILKGVERNPVSNIIYLGSGETINLVNGFPLRQYEQRVFTVDENGALWARSVVGTVTVKVAELQL